MSLFRITGGRPIKGTHVVPGNKNACLPMIAAALLTDEPVTLENVPEIADVASMLACAETFGVKVTRDFKNRTVTLDAARLKTARLSPVRAKEIRTSFLFAGPLLARKGRVSLPPPGGDGIGHRRLDAHYEGFLTLGATAALTRNGLSFQAKELTGAYILLDEASVTATENILMAAVLAKGETTIYNAACEPHVQDLATMLNAMGADVTGAGTNRICVRGVEKLKGCHATVGADMIEAVSYLVAAAVTGGELTLEKCDMAALATLAKPLQRFGLKWQVLDAATGTVYLPPRQKLRLKYDLGDTIPSVADGPWPMFPSDLISILIVLATQARGTCVFHEKMFESRLYFVDHLVQMGAKIVVCDPHRAVVTGPTTLRGTTVTSPDIRAGMALILAALAARGTTEILNAGSIDRGYESVERTLAGLGADIRRS